MDLSEWSVRHAMLVGNLLLLCNIEHFFCKKGVKKFLFLAKIGNKITIVVSWGDDRDYFIIHKFF